MTFGRYAKVFGINVGRFAKNTLMDFPLCFLEPLYQKWFLSKKGVPFSTSVYSKDNDVAMKHYPEQKVLKKYEPSKKNESYTMLLM